MLGRLLHGFAVLASLFVIAAWGLFAIGEGRSASNQTKTEIEGRRAARSADPSPDQERSRERSHSRERELVDDVNDVLLSPFTTVSEEAGSRWVRRSVPAAIALVVYGFGLSLLAGFARR